MADADKPQTNPIIVWTVAVFAVFVHLFGWLAPLTPSEGQPNVIELGLFYILPIAALAWCGLKSGWIERLLIFWPLGVAMAWVYGNFYLTTLS